METAGTSKEYIMWLNWWLEKHPLYKEVYESYISNGNYSFPQYFAELDFLKDFEIIPDISYNPHFIWYKFQDSGKIIAYPAKRFGEEMNKDTIQRMFGAVQQLCKEQLADSPHRYVKCPEEGTVLDLGCSEGLFPALYCGAGNKVIGVDCDESFEKSYKFACKRNGITAEFVYGMIDETWVVPESFYQENIVTVKMDNEGAELQALIKLKDVILKNKPQLQICAYHTQEAFQEILDYCINGLGYSNFTFNKNHMLFNSDYTKIPIGHNFLRQGLIIANG